MGIGGKGRSGICVLVRAPEVPVFRICQGLENGLFDLRFEETLVCSGVSSETGR